MFNNVFSFQMFKCAPFAYDLQKEQEFHHSTKVSVADALASPNKRRISIEAQLRDVSINKIFLLK